MYIHNVNRARTHRHTHIHTHIYTDTHTHIYTHIYIQTHTHTIHTHYTHRHTQAYTTYRHKHRHTQTQTHTYTDTYTTHTHTHRYWLYPLQNYLSIFWIYCRLIKNWITIFLSQFFMVPFLYHVHLECWCSFVLTCQITCKRNSMLD